MSRYMYTAVSVANRLPGVSSSFLNGTNHMNMKYALFILTMWLSLFFKLPADIVKQTFLASQWKPSVQNCGVNCVVFVS